MVPTSSFPLVPPSDVSAVAAGLEPFAVRCLKPIGIELLRLPDGSLWADRLWQKDLAFHLQYLPNTTLVSPITDVQTIPSSHVELRLPPGAAVVGLRKPKGVWGGVVDAFRLARIVWGAAPNHGLLYAGFVEYPIPYGWTVVAVVRARRLRQPFFSFIESSAWRVEPGVTAGWKRRVRHRLSEWISTRSLQRPNLVFVTQPGYRELCRNPATRVVEVNASWIDEEWIVDEDALSALPDSFTPERPLRIGFIARLEPEKGTGIVLDVASQLQDQKNIEWFVAGQGSCADEVSAVAASNSQLTYEPVPIAYGREFLDVLANCDVVVVPSLSQEQPRIVYDAYSQAVPVIASDTAGLRSCVTEATGWLISPGDRDALRSVITTIAQDPGTIATRRIGARDRASSLTHSQMHRIRRAEFARLVH
jgi:glycosyltransferase involved in cell wall biosynthesis